MPENTAVPSVCLSSAPAPTAHTRGETPKIKAKEVIRIGRSRSRAAAAASDPDDLLGLYFRRLPSGMGGGSRGRAEADAGHGGILWHDRRDIVWVGFHAGLLRRYPSLRRTRSAADSFPCRLGAI